MNQLPNSKDIHKPTGIQNINERKNENNQEQCQKIKQIRNNN